jgi:hypothetical protein
VAGDSRNGGVTLRPRSRFGDDSDLSSTRWTFEDPPDDEEEKDPWSPGRAIRGFVDRYGWRAYALPVLIVVTVAALMTTSKPAHKAAPAAVAHAPSPHANKPATGTGPPVASGTSQLKTDQAGANSQNEALSSDALPGGPPYTVNGTGTFRLLTGNGPVVGTGPVRRYTVDVENGVTGVDMNAFSRLVDIVLDDPRSWTGRRGSVALQRVDSGPADFHVTLAASMTVRAMCGYDQQIETSCWAPDYGSRVVLNVARWVRGDVAYIGDLNAYHLYMVNHVHSHVCLADGLAPVMMQQTIGLKSVGGKICQANPWPYPPGARDAPGIESPDTPQNSPLIPN